MQDTFATFLKLLINFRNRTQCVSIQKFSSKKDYFPFYFPYKYRIPSYFVLQINYKF